MAFDWSKVTGYREDMTAEEKINLLAGLDFVPKKQFDSVASELSAHKKQLQDRMTAEEKAQAEREEADKALKEELATLRYERAVSNFKAKLLEAKYSADDADKLAKAAASGKMEDFMTAIATANASIEKSLRTEIMKGTPRPGAGNEPDAPDKATEIALSIAKSVADANKIANDAMSHYI